MRAQMKIFMFDAMKKNEWFLKKHVNFFRVVLAQLWDHVFLIQVIGTRFFLFKYFYLILIIIWFQLIISK